MLSHEASRMDPMHCASMDVGAMWVLCGCVWGVWSESTAELARTGREEPQASERGA